jgi:hypothetical protein
MPRARSASPAITVTVAVTALAAIGTRVAVTTIGGRVTVSGDWADTRQGVREADVRRKSVAKRPRRMVAP